MLIDYSYFILKLQSIDKNLDFEYWYKNNKGPIQWGFFQENTLVFLIDRKISYLVELNEL